MNSAYIVHSSIVAFLVVSHEGYVSEIKKAELIYLKLIEDHRQVCVYD